MRAVPFHLHLARGLRQLGLTSLAAEAYREALASDPASFEASFGVGEALARSRRWEAAAQAFQRAAALRPADVETRGNLVVALFRGGRRGAAAAALRRLIDLRPGEPELHLALGVIQCRIGRPWDAIRTLRWAARLRPPAPDRRFLLGEALFGDRQWREVLDGLAAAHRLRASAVARGGARRSPGRGRLAPVAAMLARPIHPPRALAAVWRGLAGGGHLLVARTLACGQPHRTLRSVRAAARVATP